MLEDLKSVKDIVEYLLAKYPETRDDDTLLQIGVLNIKCNLRNRIGDIAYQKLKKILIQEAPKLESIRRIRAKFQQEGLYQGTFRKEKLDEAEAVKAYILTGE